jgi:hypothetical protein
MDEELDNLREKSTRTSSIFDDMETGDQEASSGGGFSSLTPQQRLILAFLLFLNVIACAAGAIYLTVLQ